VATRVKLQSAVIMLLLLLELTTCVGNDPSGCGDEIDIGPQHPSQDEYSHSTTRRQAIIDYVMALYKPYEGTFYSYLRDWPADPRLHDYPNIWDVYVPYQVLEYLNYTAQFGWENTTSFLLSLINDETEYDIFGPVNCSRNTSGGVICNSVAVELFSKLGIIDELDLDAVVYIVRQSQRSSGGFIDRPWYPSDPPDLITTESALSTLDWLNRTDEIDSALALDFVLSCHKNSGFSLTPTSNYVDVYNTPLGLLCLSHLDALDCINREKVIAFVLSHFDNASGHATYEALVETERLVWSLDLLGALDRINQNAVVDWVLACQSTWQGAFMSSPNADPLIDERLEYARAALHILQMLGRMDVLNEEISLIMYPEHTTPQAYYDFISEHFPSTTTTSAAAWSPHPNVDIVAILAENAFPLAVLGVLLAPIGCAWYADRVRRIEMTKRKKRRKQSVRR